jgi:hypothetical protein
LELRALPDDDATNLDLICWHHSTIDVPENKSAPFRLKFLAISPSPNVKIRQSNYLTYSSVVSGNENCVKLSGEFEISNLFDLNDWYASLQDYFSWYFSLQNYFFSDGSNFGDMLFKLPAESAR